MNTSLPMSK